MNVTDLDAIATGAGWGKEANLSTIFQMGSGNTIGGLQKEMDAVSKAISSGQIGGRDAQYAAEYLGIIQSAMGTTGKTDDASPGANSNAASGANNYGWLDRIFGNQANAVGASDADLSEEEKKAYSGSTSLLTDPAGYFRSMGGNIALMVLGVVIVGGAVYMLATSDSVKKALT